MVPCVARMAVYKVSASRRGYFMAPVASFGTPSRSSGVNIILKPICTGFITVGYSREGS